MQDNALLRGELAIRLYHESVKELPIIDFHDHLSPKLLIDDTAYESITEAWVSSDPYKHRAMRILGVPERCITGDARPKEKFLAWAETLPHLVGNPLYRWSQMELEQILGFREPLTQANAEAAWDRLNEALPRPGQLLTRYRVEYAAPCQTLQDDPDIFAGEPTLAPSLRVDELLATVPAGDLEELETVLAQRLDRFHRAGCRFSDHSLDSGFCYLPDDGKNSARYALLQSGQQLTADDAAALRSHILRTLAGQYTRLGWVMQLHMGALRHTSARLRAVAGPAGGYAGIGSIDIGNVVTMLNDLEARGSLPRTLLFSLDPGDNEKLCVLSGSFVGEGIKGKVQLGPAWWWCDHRKGITDVLDTVSAYGVLDAFPGMTTDSRSLFSLSRHDYFRRILCSWLAEKAEKMEFPNSFEILSEIARNISYYNAKGILEYEK